MLAWPSGSHDASMPIEVAAKNVKGSGRLWVRKKAVSSCFVYTNNSQIFQDQTMRVMEMISRCCAARLNPCSARHAFASHEHQVS